MLINLFPVISILGSSILGAFSNSWLVVWSLLELNIMSFVSLNPISENYSSKINQSNTLKYFLIQSSASSLILSISLIMSFNTAINAFTIILLLSLILKIASVPLHRWFVEIISNISSLNCLLLITWQKFLPFVVICYLEQSVLEIFIFSCAIVPPIEILSANSTMGILSLSSIFNNSWILVSTSMSIIVFSLFIVLYWSAVMFIITEIGNQWEINQNSSFFNISTLFIVSNLGSLPPTAGFIAKWFLLTNMVLQDFLVIPTVLIISSVANVYIYIRLCSLNIFEGITKPNNLLKSSINAIFLSIILSIWVL